MSETPNCPECGQPLEWMQNNEGRWFWGCGLFWENPQEHARRAKRLQKWHETRRWPDEWVHDLDNPEKD